MGLISFCLYPQNALEMIHEMPSELKTSCDMPFYWLVEIGILIVAHRRTPIELAMYNPLYKLENTVKVAACRWGARNPAGC